MTAQRSGSNLASCPFKTYRRVALGAFPFRAGHLCHTAIFFYVMTTSPVKPAWPVEDIRIEDIDLEGSPRVRVQENADVILEYKDVYLSGNQMPNLHVFRVGKRYLLADGRHRLIAARRAEVESIRCYVHEGSEEACLMFALGCNAKHGVRRTHEDLRFVVHIALTRFPQWSDRLIAENVRVSPTFVGSVRSALVSQHTVTEPPMRLGKDGKMRHLPQTEPESPPEMSARTIPGQSPMFTEPPPPPTPAKPMTNAEMAHHLGKAEQALRRLAVEGCSPELEIAIAEVSAVRGACQLELFEFEKPRAKARTQQEVEAFIAANPKLGLTRDDAEWFWCKNEGCGWKVNGKAINNWQMVVRAWAGQRIFPSQKPDPSVRGSGGPKPKSIAEQDMDKLLKRLEKA